MTTHVSRTHRTWRWSHKTVSTLASFSMPSFDSFALQATQANIRIYKLKGPQGSCIVAPQGA